MIVELNLIQNLLLAIFITGGILGLIFWFKTTPKKNTSSTEKAESGTKMSGAKDYASEPKRTKSKLQQPEENTDYKNIMQVANKHAKKLIYHSSIAASDLLIGAKKTNEHMEESLDKVLQAIAAEDIHLLKSQTQQFDNDYKQSLETIQEEARLAALEMIENTKKSYEAKLEEFTNNLLKQGTSTQGAVDKKTSELLSKAETEITEYKKEKLAQADQQISELVQKVYRDVLRISIPENVHEDLIVKSLEDAKKDGMFKL